MVLDLHWVADDITATEAEGVEHIIDLWRSDQGLGQLAIDLPWVVDDVTPNEQIDLQGLAIIAYSDHSLSDPGCQRRGSGRGRIHHHTLARRAHQPRSVCGPTSIALHVVQGDPPPRTVDTTIFEMWLGSLSTHRGLSIPAL